MPTALNGSNFGFTEISPLSGFIEEFKAFTLPKVSDRSSAAILYLNSFFNCLAPIDANAESCDNLPSEPLGLSSNNKLTGVYVDGKNTND